MVIITYNVARANIKWKKDQEYATPSASLSHTLPPDSTSWTSAPLPKWSNKFILNSKLTCRIIVRFLDYLLWWEVKKTTNISEPRVPVDPSSVLASTLSEPIRRSVCLLDAVRILEYRTQQNQITRPTIDSASKVVFCSWVLGPVWPLIISEKFGLQFASFEQLRDTFNWIKKNKE